MQDMQHSNLYTLLKYAEKCKIIFLQRHLFPLLLECKNTPVQQISRFAHNLQPTFSTQKNFHYSRLLRS